MKPRMKVCVTALLAVLMYADYGFSLPLEVPPLGAREIEAPSRVFLRTAVSDLPDGALTRFRLGGSYNFDFGWVGAMWDVYQFSSQYEYDEDDPGAERHPESMNGTWDLHAAAGISFFSGDWGALAALFKVQVPVNSLTLFDRTWVLEPGVGFDIDGGILILSGDITFAWMLRHEEEDSVFFLGRLAPGVNIVDVVAILCGFESVVPIGGLDMDMDPRILLTPGINIEVTDGLNLEAAFRFALTGSTPPELGLYLPPDWTAMIGMAYEF